MRTWYRIATTLTLAALLPTAAVAQITFERVYSLEYGGETVWVCRDDYGVPHIYAPSEPALFYANGYTTAEDRLYQLELYRRDGKGTLAALLGSDYIGHDQQVRRDGYTEAERQAKFDALAQRFKTMLQSYRDGINAYIAEAVADPDNKLPKEFWDLGVTPEPWAVTDSMAIMQMMARRFGAAGGNELSNQAYLDANGWDAFNAWFPLNDPTAPTTIPDAEAPPPPAGGAAAALTDTGLPRNSFPGISPDVVQRMRDEERDFLRVLKELGLPTKLGSFANVVDTSKSATGNPMLLGAPQMGYDEPQISNEADLHAPGFHCAGMQFAGWPSILIGRNCDLAWTTTSGASDNRDTVIETLNPAQQTQYWYQSAWRDVEHRVEHIEVAGGSPVDYDVYRTVHGPVIGADLPGNIAFAMHMTYWNDEAGTVAAFLDFNLATTIAEFEQGVQQIVTSHNFVCADRFSNIGYWHVGRYPIRAVGVDPRLPVSGEGDQEWQGFRAFADLPQLLNPLQAYLSNWNNKPVYWWDHGDLRAWIGWQHVQLIIDLMDPDPSVTFDDMEAIPYNINDKGTYMQVVEVGDDLGLPAVNILPPGQSGFIDKNGVYAAHFFDQKDAYFNWQYKPFLFLMPGVISGRVRDADTLADLVGATVEAYLGGELVRSAATNDTGTYTIPDLPPGQYVVTVSQQGYYSETQTAVTVDAGATVALDFDLEPRIFEDVAKDFWARPYIEAIFREGITGGCGADPPLYCPTNNVTRGQMAVFICKAAGKTWLDPGAPTFSDVAETHPFYGWIERLADPASWGGIPPTGGCGGGRYCPTSATTRGQIAVFLCKANGTTWLDPGTPTFDDVAETHPFYGWIERLADPGSWTVPPTSGCAIGPPPRYCPTNSVTRAQMAAFLCRAFDIPY
ncbi:MAG: penicillin acylase family protein [Armatimonadota bacterium]|nr:MAG: penicillin acylase family protein [Armatimonadota bacterium]